jgi:CRISPR-associated protein Csd1
VPAIRDWWSERYQSLSAESDAVGQCLVTGRVAALADKHPPLKLGIGQPSGVALVTFNDAAYESQGLERNANGPVSRVAAEAYTQALNRPAPVSSVGR